MGSGIEPGKSSSERLDHEFLVCKEPLVHGCGFIFTTRRRLDSRSYIHNLVRVEIESYDSIITLWFGRLFFYAQTVSLIVKFGHSIPFRVIYPITEDRSLFSLLCVADCLFEHFRKSGSMENVVSKNEAYAIISNEILSYCKCLSKSVRGRLLSILEMYAIFRTVTQKALKSWKVEWC